MERFSDDNYQGFPLTLKVLQHKETDEVIFGIYKLVRDKLFYSCQNKTVDALQVRRVTWQGLEKNVDEYILKCETCNKSLTQDL